MIKPHEINDDGLPVFTLNGKDKGTATSWETNEDGLPILKKKEPSLSLPSSKDYAGASTLFTTSGKGAEESGQFVKTEPQPELPGDQTGVQTVGYKASDARIGGDIGEPTSVAKTVGGIYNTLVGSAARMAGGFSQMGQDVDVAQRKKFNLLTGHPANEGIEPSGTWRKESVEQVEKLRSPVSTKEEEAKSGQFDIRKKTLGQNIKALAFSAPSMIADVMAGVQTGGATFFAQGVNDASQELESNPETKDLPDNVKLAYTYTNGIVSAALMKFNFINIFKGTGVDKVINKNITNKVLATFIKQGVKATKEDIDAAVSKEVASLSANVARFGAKTAVSALTGAATGAAMEASHKATQGLVNLEEGKEVFDTKNIKEDIENASANLGLFSLLTGGASSLKSNLDYIKRVKENVPHLPEEHQVEFVKQSLIEKLANENAENLTDPTLIKQQKQAAKEAHEVKEQLLAGKKPDEIVTEAQQKIIDQKEKAQTELERLKFDNDIANKKIDAKIEETDGRESEANRIKLQELKEEKRRTNEDYQKNVAKWQKEIPPEEKPLPEGSRDLLSKEEIKKESEKVPVKSEDKNVELQQWHDELKNDKTVMWHGSPSGDMRGGEYGLHVGTHRAAKEALEARIGVKADGTDWNGTEEYGKTKLAGQKTLDRIEKEEGRFVKTGFNADKDVPQEDYYISERTKKATYGDGSVVPETAKPNIQPVKIKGEMSNTPNKPHEDFKANGLMKGQIKKGTAKRGYYYENVGEDAGSISAVLPNKEHLEIIEKPKPKEQQPEKALTDEEIKAPNEETEQQFKERYINKLKEISPNQPERWYEFQAQENWNKKQQRDEAAIKTTTEVPEQIPPSEKTPAEQPTIEAGKGAEPPKGEGEQAAVAGGDVGGITQAANAVRRSDRGLPEYERQPESFEQWNNEAEQKLKEGYNVGKLMDDIQKGHDPTPVENAIRKIYYATVDAEVAKNPTDELLALQKRLAVIGDIANSRAGRNLVSLKGEGSPLSSISDFYVAAMEARNTDKLTDAEKAEVHKDYEEVKAARDKAEKVAQDATAKFEEMKAENELLKQQLAAKNKSKSDKVYTKEGKRDYNAEIKNYKDELKKAKEEHDQWMKEQGIQQAGISGIVLTPKMAKIILKIAATHVEQVGVKIAEVAQRTLDDVKDIFDGITEKDIRDVFAGMYNEKKLTKNEIMAQMRELQSEAKLLNEYDNLLKGNEPKEETKKQKRNQRLTDIRKQIDALNKERGTGKYSDEAIAKRTIDANKRKQAEFERKLREGDFEKEPKPVSIYDSPEFKKKNPKLYNELLDSQNQAHDSQLKFEKKLIEEEMKRWSWGDKLRNVVRKASGTVKTLFASFDASAIGVQNLPFIVTNPTIGVEGIVRSYKGFLKQKAFDRYLTDIHNSSDWPMIKECIRITEPKSLLESGREEFFPNRFKAVVTIDGKQYGWVKIKGEKYELFDLSKPFERQFTMLGNILRVTKFRTEATKLYQKGLTWEKNPEEFKTLGKRINNLTSSPDVPAAYQNDITRTLIWSTRLIAAKLNMLGISDVAAMIPGTGVQKGYYKGLGIKGQIISRQQAYAAADLAKFAVGVVAASSLYALARGGKINTDPYDNGFLDVEYGGTKAMNFTGGFGRYISLIFQEVAGGKSKHGVFKKYAGNTDRVKEAAFFVAGKAPPVTRTVFNLAAGKDVVGQPADIATEASKYKMPLAVGQIAKEVQNDGYGALLTEGFLTYIGINNKDTRDYPPSKTGTFKIYSGTKAREVTPEEYKKYETDREDIFKKKMRQIESRGTVWLNKFGEITIDEKKKRNTKPFNKLTADERKEFESRIREQAGDEAKDKINF